MESQKKSQIKVEIQRGKLVIALLQKIEENDLEIIKGFFEHVAEKGSPCIVIGHRLSENGGIDHLHIMAEPVSVFLAALIWGRKVRISDFDQNPERFLRYATTKGCMVIVNNTR